MKKRNFTSKNLRLLAMLLSAGITFYSPTNVYAAEGDILYIQDEDEHEEVDITEETKNDMIQAEEERQETTNTSTGETSEGTSEKTEDQISEKTEDQTSGTTENNTSDKTDDEEKREFGDNEFIDVDNWSPEKDIVEGAGDIIPDTVETEWERKHGTPTPVVTPTPVSTPEPKDPPVPVEPPKQTPTSEPQQTQQVVSTTPPLVEKPAPAPKTGDSAANAVLAGMILPFIPFGIYKIAEGIFFLASDIFNKNDDLEIDGKPSKVIGSRKKKKKRNIVKLLKRNYDN